MSTALVLGAGGLTGGAFHAGVLQGLLDEGWDAADADLIVGTSAGSSTGATLRAGIPVTDHYADQTGQPVSAETEARRRDLPPRLDFSEPLAPANRLPLDLAFGSRAFLRRGQPRLGLLFGGLQPRGRMDTLQIAARIDGIHEGVPWPEAPLWICSVRVRDGRLRVFGRDESEATVGVAVAASSAVPGLLAPVTIDGAEHVDGAVHSPTNLDQVAGLGFDRVLVSSPDVGRIGLAPAGADVPHPPAAPGGRGRAGRGDRGRASSSPTPRRWPSWARTPCAPAPRRMWPSPPAAKGAAVRWS